jgi:hypothetical protein
MISVDKPQVVKQRRDIEQLRIEFEILADALHCAEHKNADGVVVQHLSFMLPYEFGGFARDLAIGNLDARKNVSHCRTPISVSAVLPDGCIHTARWFWS